MITIDDHAFVERPRPFHSHSFYIGELSTVVLKFGWEPAKHGSNAHGQETSISIRLNRFTSLPPSIFVRRPAQPEWTTRYSCWIFPMR